MLSEVHGVNGPLKPEDMGWALPHEHTFINMSPTEPRDGYMTVWEERETDIGHFTARGGKTLWDVTNGELSDWAAPVYFDKDPARNQQNPLTGSRSIANVLATKAMAEATGVNIILGTGHYFEEYFDHGWFERTSTTKIADYLIADLVDEIPGTGVRAGFLGEIASDKPVITPHEEKSFRATGRAAAETGVMVSTHCPTFPTGLMQIELLTSEGMDPERIVVGHTDTVKSVEYSLDLLRRGVYIQYDCMMAVKAGGQITQRELDRRVQYLKRVIDEGYAHKVLLSHDVSQRSHQLDHGGPGMIFVLDELRDACIAAGIDPVVYDAILNDNPRRAMFGQ